MRYDYLFVGITLTIAIISVLISLLVFLTARRSKIIWQIGILFILEFIYAIGYTFENVFESLSMKLVFNHVQYFALPFVAITWLLIAKKYQRHDYKPNYWKSIPFIIIPILVFVTAQLSYFTDVDLYYTHEFIDTAWKLGNVSFPVLNLGKGIVYYLNSISNLFLTAYVFAIYLQIYFHSSGIQKKQSASLAISSFLGIIAISTTFFSSVSTGIDLAFFLVVLTSYVIVYTMIKYEIIDLKPSAHKATFELSSDPILALNDKMDIIDWNFAAEKYFSQVKIITYRLSIRNLLPDSELLESITSKQPFSYKNKDKHFIIETVTLDTSSGKSSGYLIKFNDMTNYMERLETLQHEATHDPLTQVFNRRAFFDQLSSYFDHIKITNEEYALLMIDIDDFKVVNDTYGHDSGDTVLQEFSKAISGMIPDEATFARYGGEEFVILLRGGSESTAFKFGEAIREKIDATVFKFDNSETKIQVSIGISAHKQGCKHTMLEGIKIADDALYQSKRTGKNKVTVTKTE